MRDYARVIGIDVSLTATGLCEYDCVLEMLGFRGVCPPFPTPHTQDEHMKRLAHVLQFVRTKVDKDCFVMIEGFAFSQPNQAHQLGGIGYLIRFWLWQQGIDWAEIQPNKLKQFVAGRAMAPKEEILKEVYRRFGVDTIDNNMADAVGLCYAGLTKVGLYPGATNFQKECLLPAIKKARKKRVKAVLA